MTPIHGLCIVAALAMPVLCGLSHTCTESIKEVIGLSSLVIAAVMGNATSARRRKLPAPPASKEIQP